MFFYDVTNAYFEAPLTDAEMENYHQDFLDKLQATAEQAQAQKKSFRKRVLTMTAPFCRTLCRRTSSMPWLMITILNF